MCSSVLQESVYHLKCSRNSQVPPDFLLSQLGSLLEDKLNLVLSEVGLVGQHKGRAWGGVGKVDSVQGKGSEGGMRQRKEEKR